MLRSGRAATLQNGLAQSNKLEQSDARRGFKQTSMFANVFGRGEVNSKFQVCRKVATTSPKL